MKATELREMSDEQIQNLLLGHAAGQGDSLGDDCRRRQGQGTG